MNLKKGDFVKLSNTKAKKNSVGVWVVKYVPFEPGWGEGYSLMRIKRNGEVKKGEVFLIDHLNEDVIKVEVVKGNNYMKSGAIAHFRWVAEIYQRSIDDMPCPEDNESTKKQWQAIVATNKAVVERLTRVA